MITTGVTGRPWRASISPWGSIEPWGGDTALNWFVAAEDRWHVPADEPAVRQHRVEGTAVVETRLRVPHGDVVQRIYSVADGGGLTVVEIENESTMPVAVAFDRRDVLTERQIADVPIEGIALPAGSFVLPLGHRASLRVAVAHGAGRQGPLPGRLPTATQVVRGWLALTERASRFVLPDGDVGAGLAAAVTAERCELALGTIPRAADDPVDGALAVGELVRMGEAPGDWIPELADAVEHLGPLAGWEADMALVAAGRVLTAAGERRARSDLAAIAARRTPGPRPGRPPSGVRAVPWLETQFALAGALVPSGIPRSWWGQSFDVYGVPTGDASSVSYAVRWHGERPAVLWEQSGPPVQLTAPLVAPGWSTGEPAGEALWAPVQPASFD
ncbi:MAG TPA: hypothetical protein VIS05_13110 [Ilumatobacter sp.]